MALPTKLPTWGMTRTDLFRELEELRAEMNEMFGPFGRVFPRFRMIEREVFKPFVDVYEEKKELVIRADLPGIEHKDVKVLIEDDILTIEGERKQEKEIKEENYYEQETWYGKFLRRIALPARTKPEDLKATYKNGILEVRVPKAEVPAPKEIPVVEA